MYGGMAFLILNWKNSSMLGWRFRWRWYLFQFCDRCSFDGFSGTSIPWAARIMRIRFASLLNPANRLIRSTNPHLAFVTISHASSRSSTNLLTTIEMHFSSRQWHHIELLLHSMLWQSVDEENVKWLKFNQIWRKIGQKLPLHWSSSSSPHSIFQLIRLEKAAPLQPAQTRLSWGLMSLHPNREIQRQYSKLRIK